MDQKTSVGYQVWTHNHPKLQYPYMPNQQATQVKGTCFHVRAGLYKLLLKHDLKFFLNEVPGTLDRFLQRFLKNKALNYSNRLMSKLSVNKVKYLNVLFACLTNGMS